ncbi:hypothetical protein GCM10022215_26450 [Nocardioides fonticola]|uniref:Alanine racemase n=1 Tax=Nocardioides fonticola TaxID=450363 RepID=A0ABP7XM31_9ACTN
MTLLLSDPAVAAVPLREDGDPLVVLPAPLTAAGVPAVRVRRGLARRLTLAAAHLPAGVGLAVVEGHRAAADQQRIIDRYRAEVERHHPDADPAEIERLTSRFVSPLAVAPHVAGAAVDLTLVDDAGRPLDLGTPIDATPEQSEGRCYLEAPGLPAHVRRHRAWLAEAMTAAGLVNYPTEWWHWSFGDRYWALMTGADAAVAGPVGAGAQLTIDLDVVALNTRLLGAHLSPGTELMAVVKGDGFGLGAVEVARTALAHGATRLGVTSIAEGLELREAGIGAPILSWLNPVDADFPAARRAGIAIAVPSRRHLDAVAATAPGTRVHLHLDTGMARDGASPQEWEALCASARMAERCGLLTVEGVMGHLASGHEPQGAASLEGRARFAHGVAVAEAAGLRPTVRHLATTSAALADPSSHHDLVRAGAGIVGIDPTGRHGLRSPVRLVAPLIGVRRVEAGTPVGYDHTWRAPRATTLGLLGLGYADGLPRAASGIAEVQVRGRRRPLVGRVSMDMAVVDLGPEAPPDIVEGEPVTVFGPGDDGEPTVAEWAAWSGTLDHEILTGLGRRIARLVVGGAR